VHNVQSKLNLRHNRKVLSGLEGLLEIVGLEVIIEGVRARHLHITIMSALFVHCVFDCRMVQARTTSATLSRYRCTTAATVIDSSHAWTYRARRRTASGCSVEPRSASSHSSTGDHTPSSLHIQSHLIHWCRHTPSVVSVWAVCLALLLSVTHQQTFHLMALRATFWLQASQVD